MCVSGVWGVVCVCVCCGVVWCVCVCVVCVCCGGGVCGGVVWGGFGCVGVRRIRAGWLAWVSMS